MQKNVTLAAVLSFIVLLGFNMFVSKPRVPFPSENPPVAKEHIQELPITNDAVEGREIKITTKGLTGSLNTQGARITKILLNNYFTTIDKQQNVELLTDIKGNFPYFVQFGFGPLSKHLPNSKTVWSADHDNLTPSQPVTLTWTNPEGVVFQIYLTIGDDYLIHAESKVINKSHNPLQISSHALLNRTYNAKDFGSNAILHEGVIGVVNEKLEEYSYSNIKDAKEKIISDTKISWLGITDKYWLTTIIPSNDRLWSADVQYDFLDGKDKIQTAVSSKQIVLNPHESSTFSYNIFLGPKKFHLLKQYGENLHIKLFDRAIDFGWLYPLTKPIFLILVWINNIVKNFGIAILLLTLAIKILMFSINNKTQRSMQKMKDIQPQIEALKIKHANDKIKLNQAIFDLYKVHKINPLSGLLSVLVQIPIFFGIYKVLYVTIEMRQAKFVGWIKDLSVQDPTNLFNLFGLLNYTPPAYLHLGALPILMSLSMYVQQTLTPMQDPTQAKIMRIVPVIFLFAFSSFPAGLLVYWIFSNCISIAQQLWVKHKTQKTNNTPVVA